MKRSQTDLSGNKLIILLNISGNYKGGAQKRYLSLFNYCQQTGRNEYFLLLNESLFKECIKDKILANDTNVISIPLRYGNIKKPKNKPASAIGNIIQPKKSNLYQSLGLLSSFLKHSWGWICYSLQLIRIIRKYEITIIYAIFTGGIWSWLVAKMSRIKFIYSYNDSGASTVDKRFIKFFSSEYYVIRYADKIDFLSEQVLKKLNERNIKIENNRILITPNSFILYENYFPEYPKKNRIIFSARLTPIKNPALLIEAISILKLKRFTDFEVYFLGEGILLDGLINMKTQLKLDNVFFERGVLDTAKYLRGSKIFISIQKDNNYPSQSLLEAMACGNAIIASDVGETRRLVTENEGILVPLSAESIAEAIQILINDPLRCTQMGLLARQKVLVEHSIEKYVEYFGSIMQS